MTRIRVFIRIPSDDAFELKAQALNNDPRLKAAGIAALKFVGDKKYVADGNFLPELPPQDTVETPAADSNHGGELHVFVRIPNDDSYELQAQALNKNPLLKKAGISGLRRVGDKQYIVDGNFSPELPPQDTVETSPAESNTDGGLHVFVRIPNDDSYELKAQALNKNPLLKKAGISGLRRVGDKQYIVDGKFTSKLPTSPEPELKSPKPLPDQKLRVTIRMKNDDAYQLIADRLNGDPRLQKAGISDIKLVKVRDAKIAVAPFPVERLEKVEPVVPIANQPAPVPVPVTTKKKQKLSGCLVWGILLGVIGIIITVGGVFAANTFLPGLFSSDQVAVISPTPKPINRPTLTGPENLTQSTLLDAINNGWVIASISGDGLRQIDISLQSQVDYDLEISIGPGMVFEAQSAGVQNMVVRSGTVVVLKPNTETSLKLEVACANMELKTPSGSDTFVVSQRATPDDLIELLNLSEFLLESFPVQQFAIWTITDNPTRYGYIPLGMEDGTTDGLTDDKIERILGLFQSTGIDIPKYQMLSDWPGTWEVWYDGAFYAVIDIAVDYNWANQLNAACPNYNTAAVFKDADESLSGTIVEYDSACTQSAGPFGFHIAFATDANHNQFVGNSDGIEFCGARNGYPIPDPCYGP